MVEKPRWLRRVLRAVGLIGDGEMGVRGSGDFAVAVVVGTARLRASLGPRRASMLIASSLMKMDKGTVGGARRKGRNDDDAFFWWRSDQQNSISGMWVSGWDVEYITIIGPAK